MSYLNVLGAKIKELPTADFRDYATRAEFWGCWMNLAQQRLGSYDRICWRYWMALRSRGRGGDTIFTKLFLFFVALNVACYWVVMLMAFPKVAFRPRRVHYFWLQFSVDILGAVFNNLPLTVTVSMVRQHNGHSLQLLQCRASQRRHWDRRDGDVLGSLRVLCLRVDDQYPRPAGGVALGPERRLSRPSGPSFTRSDRAAGTAKYLLQPPNEDTRCPTDFDPCILL